MIIQLFYDEEPSTLVCVVHDERARVGLVSHGALFLDGSVLVQPTFRLVAPGPDSDPDCFGRQFDDTKSLEMKRFVAMLAGLGHAARLTIFRLLVRAGPDGCCVDDIRRRVRMPGSTLSHHLDALRRCGLLQARRNGRFIHYAVDWQATARLIRFLSEDCCADMHARIAGGTRGGGRRSRVNG